MLSSVSICWPSHLHNMTHSPSGGSGRRTGTNKDPGRQSQSFLECCRQLGFWDDQCEGSCLSILHSDPWGVQYTNLVRLVPTGALIGDTGRPSRPSDLPAGVGRQSGGRGDTCPRGCSFLSSAAHPPPLPEHMLQWLVVAPFSLRDQHASDSLQNAIFSALCLGRT